MADVICSRCGKALADATCPCPDCPPAADEKTLKITPSAAAIPDLPPEYLPAANDPRNHAGRLIRLRRLGRGGMGEVWQAWDKILRRVVAVKYLIDASDDDCRRLLREAQVAAGLEHDRILPVYEVSEDDRGPRLITKYIDGFTLDRAELTLRQKIQAMRAAAEAIAHAHGKGVIHRDLKPQNIMVEDSSSPGAAPRIYVLDFGLARQTRSASSLSVGGTIVGTPQYMSPEQAQGRPEDIDMRTDVYGLGATLYMLLTGVPPFNGEDPSQILYRVIHDDPIPPRRLNPALPRDLDTIALKCLEKDKARRYESAQALADDLGRWLEGESILARRASIAARFAKKVGKHPGVFSLVALLLIVLSSVAAVEASGRIRLDREIDELALRARDLESKQDYDEAIKCVQAIVAKDPARPAAAGRLRELELLRDRHRQKQEVESRRANARALLDSAVPLVSRYRDLSAELPALAHAAENLEKEIAPHASAEAKRPLWEARTRRDQAARELEEAFNQATTRLLQAFGMGVEPEREHARSRVASLYWERFEEAERRNDRRDMSTWKSLALFHDDSKKTIARRLDAPGKLSLETNPSGADVYLFRYVAGPDFRWIPQACTAQGVEVPGGTKRASSTEAYPLMVGDGNRIGRTPLRDLELPQGSYLALLVKEGFSDARVPVHLTRGRVVSETVPLYTSEQIGKGFVYVPAAPFWKGGDASAFGSGPWMEARVKRGFFMSTHEITMEEYRLFIEDVKTEEGNSAAFARVPRHESRRFFLLRPNGVTLSHADSRDKPVYGISWKDAAAYAEWRTRKEGGGVTYRLPTEDEWEWAARGADGRYFVWGDAFDWTWGKTGQARPGQAQPEIVGSFPFDESPFGVLDMAGSSGEYCQDAYDDGRTLCVLRGGSWSTSEPSLLRSAARIGWNKDHTALYIGFRIVRFPNE